MIEEIVKNEVARVNGRSERPKHQLKRANGVAKKSAARKFTDVFFAEDYQTVKTGLFNEVVIPTIKGFFADLFIGGIERALFGSGGGRSNRVNQPYNYSTSLVRDFNPNARNYQQPKSIGNVNRFDDVILRDRASATDFLNTLRGAIKEYGNVSVAELYDALHGPDETRNADFTDNYVGWKNLDSAQIRRVTSGYQIILPDPTQLD